MAWLPSTLAPRRKGGGRNRGYIGSQVSHQMPSQRRQPQTLQLRRTVRRHNYRPSRNSHAEWRHLPPRLKSEKNGEERGRGGGAASGTAPPAATAAPRRDRKTTRAKPRALRALEHGPIDTRFSPRTKGLQRGREGVRCERRAAARAATPGAGKRHRRKGGAPRAKETAMWARTGNKAARVEQHTHRGLPLRHRTRPLPQRRESAVTRTRE
nr:uncharacterized protein LOC126527125 [Dermacentor andersoni]